MNEMQMTYPDDPSGLQKVGMFQEESKKGDDFRKRLAAIGTQWFNLCQNERMPQERQWYLNLAFYNGQQFVQFKNIKGPAGASFDLYTPPAPPWRVRIVINQIRRIVRKEISRLTAQKPNAYIVPSTTEDADVFAAQAGEQIWDSLWRRLKFNKTLRSTVFWQVTCGNGFIKTYWDEDKVDPDNPEEKGDICIETVSPFYIFVPDLMQEDLEAQPYLIHAQVRSNAWIKQAYGIDRGDTALDAVDDKLQQVMGVQRNNSKKDMSTILEIWVKPGYIPELPNGGMFTIAANQIVQGYDSWPYDHAQYPFAKVDGILTGKFYSASVVEDLIPLNQELNRTRGQMIEAKNKMSKPQLLAEKGSVDPKRITTEPGQVIEFRMGSNPPQPLPLQNIPTYVTEEINRLYTDMSDLSGQHEVSNGSTPPGVTAATAISFLQEQDESLTASQYSSLEEAIEKTAAQSLMYVKSFWQEERTVKIVGLEGSFDVQTFKGANLRGNTDIRIESGSALPTSRAAKQAFLMDLMKMGFIPPEKGLELMEIGGINRLYEGLQIDKRQAQRENLKMRVITEEDLMAHNETWAQENGVDPETGIDPDSGMKLTPPLIVSVHTYDNHDIHIEEHNRYRKSQAFETASKITKALFEEHVKQHMEAAAGLMTHPLTGLEGSNPNAPEIGEEENIEEQMLQEEAEGGGAPTGPEVMPELEGEQPQEMM